MLLHLIKNCIDICFFYSLHQLIIEPTRTTEYSKKLPYHVLTNSPEKVIQIDVTYMGLSHHELIHCSRRTSLSKLNVLD